MTTEPTDYAVHLRRRLTETHWNASGRFDFMLTDEPLTKAQVATLISAALWARHSGWGYSDEEAGRVAAEALEAARPGWFQ